jgi:hypothetical protein
MKGLRLRFILLFIGLIPIEARSQDSLKSEQKDTLYDSYEAIYAGMYQSFDIGSFYIDADYYENDSLISQQFSYTGNASLSTGIKINTRYYSFGFAFESDSDGEVKSFGAGMFLRNIQASARYTKITGLYSNYVVFDTVNKINTKLYLDYPSFTTKKYEGEVNYYFNKKFSKGNFFSLLSFPRKNTHSISLKAGFILCELNNYGNTFITRKYSSAAEAWDHLHRVKYYGLHLLPGWNNFRVMSYLKKKTGAIRKIRLFYATETYIGPSIISSQTWAVNERYQSQDLKLSLSYLLNVRLGINTRHFLIDVRGGAGAHYVKNLYTTINVSQIVFNINIGYRIPFRKGYQRTEAFKATLTNVFKKE